MTSSGSGCPVLAVYAAFLDIWAEIFSSMESDVCYAATEGTYDDFPSIVGLISCEVLNVLATKMVLVLPPQTSLFLLSIGQKKLFQLS